MRFEENNYNGKIEYNNNRIGKKKRKRKSFFRLLLKFCFVVVICFFIGKLSYEIFYGFLEKSQNVSWAGDGSSISKESLEDISDSEKSNIIKKLKKENYPDSLITLFEKHTETKDFVLDYPNYKDKEEASNSDSNIKIKNEIKKGEIPLLLQWDKRWGYKTYGGDFIAVTGCGPLCLSMVYCGLSGSPEWNPYKTAKMAEENGFYVDGSGSSWELMTTGALKMGLSWHEVRFEKDKILSELRAGNPVICVVGPGDFTSTGHFIVLADADNEGNVLVRDPNSIVNSSKMWSLERIMPQVRNLWGYTI